jgi:acyl-CoA thioesterase I
MPRIVLGKKGTIGYGHVLALGFVIANLIALCANAQTPVSSQSRDNNTQTTGGRRGGGPAPNTDWPALKRYQADNAALPAPTPGKPRAVFMGDSITQGWAAQRGSFFADNGYVGRGISAQTSPQMVLRFHQDVVALKPAAVVILAGTNDIAENTGPMTEEQTIDNLTAMTEIAHANGIKVVICSVTPATRFFWRPEAVPAPRIKSLNAKIKAWAQEQKLVYADFWTAMAQSDGTMNPAYAADTVHPNAAGYGVMEPIVQAAIAEALKGTF